MDLYNHETSGDFWILGPFIGASYWDDIGQTVPIGIPHQKYGWFIHQNMGYMVKSPTVCPFPWKISCDFQPGNVWWQSLQIRHRWRIIRHATWLYNVIYQPEINNCNSCKKWIKATNRGIFPERIGGCSCAACFKPGHLDAFWGVRLFIRSFNDLTPASTTEHLDTRALWQLGHVLNWTLQFFKMAAKS